MHVEFSEEGIPYPVDEDVTLYPGNDKTPEQKAMISDVRDAIRNFVVGKVIGIFWKPIEYGWRIYQQIKPRPAEGQGKNKQ